MRLNSRATTLVLVAAGVAAVFGVAFIAFGLPFASPGPAPGGPDNGTAQSVTIAGTVNLKVYSSDGTLVSARNVPDPLSMESINAIAACASGGAASPAAFEGCSGWVSKLNIQFSSPGGTCVLASGTYCASATVATTNYLLPIGCNPVDQVGAASPAPECSGWESQAIFGPSTFTTSNCASAGSTCPVQAVFAGVGNPAVVIPCLLAGGSCYTQGNDAFDWVYTTSWAAPNGVASIASVGPGQTLVVTITYTVS